MGASSLSTTLTLFAGGVLFGAVPFTGCVFVPIGPAVEPVGFEFVPVGAPAVPIAFGFGFTTPAVPAAVGCGVVVVAGGFAGTAAPDAGLIVVPVVAG